MIFYLHQERLTKQTCKLTQRKLTNQKKKGPKYGKQTASPLLRSPNRIIDVLEKHFLDRCPVCRNTRSKTEF